jgi:large subunit ribosomal protein L29
MTFPKYSELNELNTIVKIDEEILLLQKKVFNLKMKRSGNQVIKSHIFKHTKHRIAQLNFKKGSLLKSQAL